MEILSTKLTLHASGTLPLKPLCDLASKLGAEFLFMPAGYWPPLACLTTTFASGNEIHSEHPIGKLVFCASDAALTDYAGYVKEKLIQQTCELMENQIRDRLNPPKNAEPASKDACEFCGGNKGGTPGNENIIDEVVVCDYCTALLMDMDAARAVATQPEPEPKLFVGTDIWFCGRQLFFAPSESPKRDQIAAKQFNSYVDVLWEHCLNL